MDMSGMSMGGGDGSMGNTSMGNGVPSLFYLQKMFWAVIGTVIACATIVNVYDKLLWRQRLTTAEQGNATPARPNAVLPSSLATMTAVFREITYATLPLALATKFRWTSPTLGRVLLVLGELVVVVVFCFYKLNPRDQWQWENMGYRTGFIATAQLPLIFLLAGKNNIIGFLIGSSYERLNWLHRWASRILWLTVTMHMGFWFSSWARYDYIKVKLTTDNMTQTGFAAWCVLTWIVFSSSALTRRWNYELFVIQHLVSFVGFIATVYLHVPAEVRVWVWISIGLYIVDRCGRALTLCYANLAIFHPKSRGNGFLACKATFEPLTSDTTRIVISNPPISWTVGQYVLLSCHGIAPLQSHPFTVASIPEDGKMEFIVKSKAGGTRRFFKYAEQHNMLPLTSGDLQASHTRTVTVEGPYGRMRPLRQFDSLIMFAGSSGGSFTVPLVRDIVSAWKAPRSYKGSLYRKFRPMGAATRYIRFIWVVKSREQYSWFSTQLTAVAQDVEQLKRGGSEVDVEMSIYITCDEILEVERDEALQLKSNELPYGQPQAIPIANISTPMDQKNEQMLLEDTVTLHSTSSQYDMQQPVRTACGPNGRCCCKTTIEDEDAITNATESCQCNCSTEKPETGKKDSLPCQSSNASIQSTNPLSSAKPTAELIPSEVSVLSGRPQPRTLIRKALEQALGESAVVVCGPQGLIDNVRQSVVALSDERAVHKGSGAQGIYLHTEGFGY